MNNSKPFLHWTLPACLALILLVGAVGANAAGRLSLSVGNIAPSGALASDPTISSVSTNLASYPGGKVPRFERLEISFQVDTTATNPYWPYEAAPPAGLEPGSGVTVNAYFSPDNWKTVYMQPAFYYQDFSEQVKGNQEWFYPTGGYQWKVRFAPHIEGNWQYKLTAQDASGSSVTAPASFSVVPSSSHGFLRVSSADRRYFEFDDGTYFPSLGVNLNARRIDLINPTLSNQANFQVMGQNGIQFIRWWLSQGGLYASAWSPWASHNKAHQTQEPQVRITHPNDPTFKEQYPGFTPPAARPGSEVYLWLNHDEKVSSDGKQYLFTPCMVLGWEHAPVPLKRNTAYRVRVRYQSAGLQGPRIAGKPFGFVVKEGGWLWNESDISKSCYSPGTGTLLAASYSQTAQWNQYPDSEYPGWTILEGHFNSGERDFIERLYLAIENATSGHVFVDYVWVEEELGGGQAGPNLVYKPWFAMHKYYDQRNAFAFDKVVELAHQYDIYLRPVILEKNDHLLNFFEFDGSMTSYKPSQNPNHLFFGNGRETNGKTKVRWMEEAWMRYLQARWGYSPNIHSWELLNEGSPGDKDHWILADELGKSMQCEVFGVEAGDDCRYDHPNSHMVSTSFWGGDYPWHFYNNTSGEYPDIDFADIHQYPRPADPTFYDAALDTYQLSTQLGAYQPGGSGKLFVRGEVGFNFESQTDLFAQNATDGLWLHNFIWGGINPGGLIDQYWIGAPTHKHIQLDGSHDHRSQYRPYFNFIRSVPLNNGHYQDAAASATNSSLRVWGQKDLANGQAHLWIQNSNHTWKKVYDGAALPPVSGTVTIGGFLPGASYRLEWWDTNQLDPAKQITSTATMTAASNGNLSFNVSNLAADVAVKLYPLNPLPSTVFSDVPVTYPYAAEISALYQAGYSAGCSAQPLLYCPDAAMNRSESAVFVERGLHGAGVTPADPGSSIFADLSPGEWALKWATALFQDGFTAGCGTSPLVYCPWQGHTRAEAAVFYLRMLHGAAYNPPAPQGLFVDAPVSKWYTKWLEAAYNEGLLPACLETPRRICPDDPLDRGLAAFMMVQAKNLD